MFDKPDVYQRVTDQIIATIEAGAGTWQMPWHVKASDGDPMPYNVVSKRHYRGVNTVALWAIAQSRGYTSNAWGTYQQWLEMGAQVRKGEKSAVVVFWKFDRVVTETPDGDESRERVFAKAYHVFNADQVDGYQAKPREVLPEPERIAHAEAWFAALGATIHHGGNRCYYRPSADAIYMAPYASFTTPRDYYSTLAHEATHWTGHETRCNRNLRNRFGDEAYAAEELVAELGAAFVCALLQLDSVPRPDHAQYLANWLKVLKNDKRAIFTAASQAQRAVDYMADRQPSNDAGEPDEAPHEMMMAA